jgi:predicted dehydrogenase
VDKKTVDGRIAEFSLHEVKVFSDVRRLCEDREIDAIDVCLPIRAHLDAVLAGAEAGKHILVEKPMTLNLDEAKKAVQAARQNRVTLMVAHDQRFRPRHQKMKELIPRLGEIVCARADINQDLETILPPGHWHRDHRGALLAIGVHMLDLLRFLIGDVRRVSCFEKTRLVKMRGNDIAVAILEFECGALGTLVSTWASKGSPWHDSILVQGSRGACHTIGGLYLKEGNSPFTCVYAENDTTDGKGEWRFRTSYREEIRHFLECIRDGNEPMTSGHDNLKTMAAIEAMFLSSKEGRPVEIGELLKG